MALVMKGSIKMEKKMEKEYSNGQMVQYIQEILTKIIYKDKENTNGKMVDNTQGNGKIIKWMEKGYILV